MSKFQLVLSEDEVRDAVIDYALSKGLFGLIEHLGSVRIINVGEVAFVVDEPRTDEALKGA